MRCPFCSKLDNKVIDSRLSQAGEVVRRRRECEGCARRYTTYERIEQTLPLVVKKDGRRQPYDRVKLLAGLRRACVKRPVSAETLERLLNRLERQLVDIGDPEVSSSPADLPAREPTHSLTLRSADQTVVKPRHPIRSPASMLTLRTFGGVALLRDDVALDGPASQRRRIALLALLAAGGTRGVSRDTIVALLWPDSEPERARHALSQWLFLLRRDLDANDIVLGTAELRLNSDRVRSDVAEFDAAIARRDYAAAAQLYTGPFLDGFVVNDAPEFERWIDRERARRHREAVQAMESVAREAERTDRGAAVAAWRQLATVDPMSGRVAANVIRVLRDSGDHASALAHMRAHEDVLRKELDVAPSPEVQTLGDQLRAEAASAAPRENGSDEAYVEFVRQRVGHLFQVERVTSRTSLATSFDTRRLSDGEPLTLKVLLPNLVARTNAERLCELLVAAGHVKHAHITPLGLVGEAGGILFIAGPRVSDGTLRDHLDREGKLGADRAVRLGAALAGALAHGEAKGILHLDLTPRRVLLGDGGVRVSDFGVMHALHVAQQHTPVDSGMAPGTPAYMSPEQLEGDASVGSASDVYSLACVLFHAIAGQPPHAAAKPRALIAKRLGSPPPSAREQYPGVPSDVDALLVSMLSVSPTARPSLAQVARELEQLAETVSAD